MFNMKKKKDFLFDKSNYKYVIIGIIFIIIGFLLMLGGGSKIQIYSPRRFIIFKELDLHLLLF